MALRELALLICLVLDEVCLYKYQSLLGYLDSFSIVALHASFYLIATCWSNSSIGP
jgi:hypothetical protein